MIVETMNDVDKGFEAFRMTPTLCSLYESEKRNILDRFVRGTRFPYFQRYAITDDRMNKWTLLIWCCSKTDKKRGAFYIAAYTIYEIARKTKKVDENCGKGILIFDPLAMRRRINGENEHCSVIYDIVPHAFNRYTQRYLKPKGLGDMEFQRKIENLLIRFRHFDVSADLYGDKNAKKHSKDGICPYDVIMLGGGMLRGYVADEFLIRINTYISDDMMYDNQIERMEKMNREYYEWKRKGINV